MTKRNREQKLFYYNMPGLYEKKIQELDAVETKVVWLLHHDIHLRNCDKCLIFNYWQNVDGLNTTDEIINESIIHSLTSSESIRRCRQFVQNELGLFLPTDENVIVARNISKDAVQHWTGTHKQ